MPIDADAVPLVVAFVALVVGLLGAVVSSVAIVQRSRADRREALWERARTAIAMTQSRSPVERRLGTDLVALLLDQGELTQQDAEVLELALGYALAEGSLDDAAQDEVAAVIDLSERRPPPVLDSSHAPTDDGPTRGGTDD